jgi:hypothetical protein
MSLHKPYYNWNGKYCIQIIIPMLLCRGSQRDVVYLGWPVAPSYMSPNTGGGGGVAGSSQWVPLYTGARNFGDLTPYLTYANKQRWQRSFIFRLYILSYLHLKGTQDWDFFCLRFWNLIYFFISYVKILRFYKKFFLIRPLLGEIRFFRLVWD